MNFCGGVGNLFRRISKYFSPSPNRTKKRQNTPLGGKFADNNFCVLTYMHEIAVLYTLFSKIFFIYLHLSSNRTKNNLILPLKRIFLPLTYTQKNWVLVRCFGE